MNCTTVRDQLPGLLYGHLQPDDAHAVEKHVANCPDCTRELTALRQVPCLLDAVPVPTVAVDLPRLYRQAAERQERRVRRWRRVAVALSGVAAALAVLAFGLRLEARLEPHQMVLRWGSPPPVEATVPVQIVEVPVRPVDPALTPSTPVTKEQLRLFGELIRLLAVDVQDRDRRQQEQLAVVWKQVQALQEQSLRQYTSTKQQVDALYTAQFVLPNKGVIP